MMHGHTYIKLNLLSLMPAIILNLTAHIVFSSQVSMNTTWLMLKWQLW